MTRLKAHRIGATLTQKELAAASGVSSGMISSLEKEGIGPPTSIRRKKILLHLAEALGCSLEDLMDRSPDRVA